MAASVFDWLSLELVELICDLSNTSIEQHHVRSQLRATCRFFRNSLKAAHVKSFPTADRARIWFKHGATTEFILSHRLSNNIMHLAASANRLDVMQTQKQISWTLDIAKAAAQNGSIDCLRHIFETKHDVPDVVDSSKYLKYKSKYIRLANPTWNEEVCIAAAANGHLDCLRYAFENARSWKPKKNAAIGVHRYICSSAAKNGHLDCLRYAHKNNCKLDYNTCEEAGSNGHLHCLQYAHENGCEWYEDTCSSAAKNGQLLCLRYAHENGCPWDDFTCSEAAKYGHLHCLQYAHENGCDWDWYTCTQAAAKGHLECLRYAHINGCDWGEEICVDAAKNGHLECLRYAHENCCPWNEYTCNSAAKYGHLICLRYAHENGCPWDQFTCINAARYGHSDCLAYARENGCPWGNTCEVVARSEEFDYLQPWDSLG